MITFFLKESQCLFYVSRSKMYRKQKVSTLSHKALLTLGNTIVQSLHFAYEYYDDGWALSAQKIKEYLKNSNVTSRIYQDLFKKILECYISREVFLLAMEAIFDESIKSIENPKVCYLEQDPTYWDIILRNPGGFQKLQFGPIGQHMCQLAKVLEKSPNLKEIEVGRSDLMCISSLAQTLTKINIFGIERKEVAKILLSCPNMESLCSFQEVGESLMICLEYNKNFRSKLKYVSQYISNKKIFEAIVLTCPQMNTLHLHIIKDDSLFVLEQTFLSELQFMLGRLNTNRIMALLAKIGCNLRHLKFIQYDQRHEGIDLAKLCQFCPSLRTFEFEMRGKIYMSHTLAYFDCLEKFVINFVHISMSKLDFIILLSNLKSLECFEVSEVPFDDDDIQSVFGGRDFVNLTTFLVRSSDKLTAKSVHVLLECCPKLEFIGYLTNWNISKKEIALNFECLKDFDDCEHERRLDTRYLNDEYGSENDSYESSSSNSI